MIQLSNYHKLYGQKEILSISELHLAPGLYWIKGVNGSGKSTLFKSIAGIIDFKGECSVDNVNIRKAPIKYREKVNYAEAEPLFPDFLTIKDLAEFVAPTKKATKEQLQQLIQVFGVIDYYNDRVSTFSSGMLKKTGLLLAFLGNPSVIILDEPFITIDQQSTEKLVKLIMDLHQNKNITFLVATHMDTEYSHLPYDKVFTIANKTLLET